MNSLVEFLYPAPAPRTVPGILGWWERRRLPYNLLVGAAGLVSLTAMAGVNVVLHGPTMIPWQPIVVFAVGANVFYFLGPLVEITVTRLWGPRVLPVGPALYRMGLTFAVGLALFPTLLLAVYILVRVLGIFV